MKDFKSIVLNALAGKAYRTWVSSIIRGHGLVLDNPFILDVSCGANKISKSNVVKGCDKFPASDEIIQAEADDLPFGDGMVDMLVSAHCLEHMANPIKAIKEWCRAVGRMGTLWFILPHRDRTFDRLRPLTTVDHVIDDFNNRITEDDQTHWVEFRDLTILSGHRLIPPEYLQKAKEDDFEYFNNQRLIHHHVWTLTSFIELAMRLNLEILYAIDEVPGRKDSFSLVARSCAND